MAPRTLNILGYQRLVRLQNDDFVFKKYGRLWFKRFDCSKPQTSLDNATDSFRSESGLELASAIDSNLDHHGLPKSPGVVF